MTCPVWCAQVDAKGRNSGTPALVIALKKGNEAIVRMLLEGGAKVDVVGEDDEPAMIMAIKGRNEAVVRMLLERGVSARCAS